MNLRLKTVLVTLAWGTIQASVILGAMFQGFLIAGSRLSDVRETWPVGLAYLLVFAVSVLCGTVLADLGMAVLASFSSFIVTLILEYSLLSLPAVLGLVYPPELGLILVSFGLGLAFNSLFPIVLIVSLAGGLVGAGVGEMYLD